MKSLLIDPSQKQSPTRDHDHHHGHEHPHSMPDAKEKKIHPQGSKGTENASLFFVGTATTILYASFQPEHPTLC